MRKSFKVLFVTTDLDPFCKAGGLGDVSRDLPQALFSMGHDVRIMMPRHGAIKESRNGLKLYADGMKTEIAGKEIGFQIKTARLDDRIPVYFIEKHKYFGNRSRLYGYKDENMRFLFFCKAVVESLACMEGWVPDIIHCNDWHTGLIPEIIKTNYNCASNVANIKTLFTIHNLTFQMGTDWWSIPLKNRDDGTESLESFIEKRKIKRINFSRRGIMYADLVNTVSECYAREILQKKTGQNLHELLREKHGKGEFVGIVNGIDYDAYNPRTDPGLACRYHADDFDSKYKNKIFLQKKYGLKTGADIPLLGMVTRITEQKGFDLLEKIIEPLLELDLQLIIIGDGEQKYKSFFRKISQRCPKKVAVSFEFQRKNTTQIYAASDMFLMPSRFEPCGLGQMISLRYGSVPIVRKTGGLSDTIENYNPHTGKGNGFTFRAYKSSAFLDAVARALEAYKNREEWRRIVTRGMHESFSWEVPAKKYLALYRKMMRKGR